MAEFLIFVVAVFFAIWLNKTNSKTRAGADELAKLTYRVFILEEELKKLQRAPAIKISTPVQEVRPAPMIKEAAAQPASFSPVIRPAADAPPEPVFTTPMEERSPLPADNPGLFSGTLAEPVRDTAFSIRSVLNLEEKLGTNWLNKLGIAILVIGIALFLAYQLSELGPQGKIATGFAVSALMVGAGVFFDRREQWRILARAGLGGGWALTYFTTYAMYHVPAAKVLSSEAADLVLLLIVTVAMVANSLRYRSQVATGLAFLLAFTTINISHGNAYSLIASAILAAALAVVAVQRQWFEMELAGMIAAFLNHYLWLRPIIEPMHGRIHAFPGYTASLVLLMAYWAIFRASYVARRVDTRRQEQISTIAAVLNPALLLALLGYQSVHPELSFQFLLAAGAIEMALGQLPVTRRRRDAFVVLTALGSCLLAAALPQRFSDSTLSIAWLAEGEALLLAGVFLSEILFRRLALLAILLAWMHMIGVDAGRVYFERAYGVYQGSHPGLAIFFGIAALVLYADAYWIPRRWPTLVCTDLERLCFRRIPHMAGALAFICAWLAWPGAWTAVVWAGLALLLTYLGRRLELREVSIDGLVCAAAAVLRALIVNFGAAQPIPHFRWMTQRLLTVPLLAVALYFASRWAGVPGMASPAQLAPLYTWAASALAALLAWYELRPVAVALAWTLLGLALLETGIERRSASLRLQAYVAFGASFLRLFFVNLNAAGSEDGISPRLYTVLPLAVAFYYVYGRLRSQSADAFEMERRIHAAGWHSFLGLLTLVALMRFEFDPDLVVVGWAALTLVLTALAWRSGIRLFLHQGLLLSFCVLWRGILHNLYERSYFPAPFGHGSAATVSASVALLALALPFAFSLRRLNVAPIASDAWYRRFPALLDQRPEQVLFFVPFALLTAMLALQVRVGLITLAWGVEGVAVFMLAIRVKERSYRLAGLGLLLTCVGKIILRDVWGLAPRDRYLTFITLGSALVGVSYLYTRYRNALRQYL